MKFFYYIFILFIVHAGKVYCQKDSAIVPGIKVIARVQKDGITLRWGASNSVAWEYANNYGYMVERYTIVQKGKTLSKPVKVKVTSEPIKPAPLNEWEAIAKADKYGAIAAQALYGETFEVNPKAASVMQMVNKSKEQDTRFSFALFCADQSLEVANKLGLKLTDKFIFSAERYLYKVYVAMPNGLFQIDTGYVFVESDKIQVLPKPAHVSAEFGDRSVMLSWENVYDDIYSSYFVERSTDGGASYHAVNAEPYLNTNPEAGKNNRRTFMMDSLPANNKEYIYRIKGKSYFAVTGPASDILKGQGISVPTAVPVIKSAKIIDNKQVTIAWEFPVNMNGKIKAFILASSTSPLEPMKNTKEIAAPGKRELSFLQSSTAVYYVVKAMDMQGKEYASTPYLVQLKDHSPPAAPAGLSGSMDTLGLVKIFWKCNREEDLEGYRVYQSNSMNDEFTQVTKSAISDTLFTDTTIINTLSEKVYYKIVAVDHHFNISKFSKILVVNRPDKVAPAPAIIINCIASDSLITIEWLASASKDVVKYEILRRAEGTKEWNKIYAVDSSGKKYVYRDRNADTKTVYEYSVMSYDEAGNYAYALQSARAKKIDNCIRPEIENIRVEADRTGRAIVLYWNYPYKEVSRYSLYRSEEGKPLKLYKTFPAGQESFSDGAIKIATNYKYLLKASFKDGGSSPMSREVTIKF